MARADEPTVTVDATMIDDERELSVLVEIDGIEHVLPKSQITISPGSKRDHVDIVIPEWLARKRGIV